MRFDITRYWYSQRLHWITLLLLPFSLLFGLVSGVRRFLYRSGILKNNHFSMPVIVVGNITVGGTGKTPFVIWLASALRKQGYRPGIVSRGVGGKKAFQPYRVSKHDAPHEVGDEAIVLAQRTDCPVMISIDRVKAVSHLLQTTDCNIVLSDDGLQHYRLARDIEIIIVDHLRSFGNQLLLPAGPLREPISRLKETNWVVRNGESGSDVTMSYEPIELISINHPEKTQPLSAFAGEKIHAVAAIGHPERFFLSLQEHGFDIIQHVFPDHYLYTREDFETIRDLPIVMTEKDAVKCRPFADDRYWYVRIAAKINKAFEERLIKTINEVSHEIKARVGQPIIRGNIRH